MRGLLALCRPTEAAATAVPRCEHAGVRIERSPPSGLALGGLVRLAAFARAGGAVLAVDDSGAGPPPALRDTMHEPFVTGKAEGIGWGLKVAWAVAEEHGGGLEWERVDGRTRIAIFLPEQTLEKVARGDAPPVDSPAPSPVHEEHASVSGMTREA